MVTRMKNDEWEARIKRIVERERALQRHDVGDLAITREVEELRQQHQLFLDMNWSPMVGTENDWRITNGERLA